MQEILQETEEMLMLDRTVLITGANRGIGLAIAVRLAQEGAVVYAGYRTKEAFGEIAEKEPELSKRIVPIQLDVCDKQSILNCIKKIKSEKGKLDVLVNNAGITRINRLEMLNDEAIDLIYQTNVYGTIHVTQAALRLMKKSEYASIVNLSSVLYKNGDIGQTAYASSKAAVSTMTKVWARELASSGIRVNAVAPGSTDTEMFNIVEGELRQESMNKIGMNRLAKPEEIANVVLFLASDMASYVTGEVIGASGGWFA